MSDPFDLGSMLAGAMEMQQRFEAARAEVEASEFTGTAGGDAVSITVTGNLRLLDVSIAPEAIEAGDVSLLEDMVMAAFTDALAQIDRMQQEVLGEFQMPDVSALGDLGDLGGLGDLSAFGGPASLDGPGIIDIDGE